MWPQYTHVAQWCINTAFGWTHQSRVDRGIQVASFIGSCPSAQERTLSWIMFLEQNKSVGEERFSFIPDTLHWCANNKIISNKLRTDSWMSYIAMTYHAQMYNTSFHLAPFSSDSYAFLLCPARPVLVSNQMVFPLLDYLIPFLANSGACHLQGTDVLHSSLQRIRKCFCMHRQ